MRRGIGDLRGRRGVGGVGGVYALPRTSVLARRPCEVALIRDGEEPRTFGGTGATTLKIDHRDKDVSPGGRWYDSRVAQQGPSPRCSSHFEVARGHLS